MGEEKELRRREATSPLSSPLAALSTSQDANSSFSYLFRRVSDLQSPGASRTMAFKSILKFLKLKFTLSGACAPGRVRATGVGGGLLAAVAAESLLSLSAFAPTKRRGEEEVTRGPKEACFIAAAAGRRPTAALEAARRREESSIGVFFFLELSFLRVRATPSPLFFPTRFPSPPTTSTTFPPLFCFCFTQNSAKMPTIGYYRNCEYT